MGYEVFERLTDENFDDQTFDSTMPSLVFFGAERCDICKELQPIIEELIQDYAGRLNVYFVDVDTYGDLHKRFRLRGIPQLLIINDAEVKTRIGGLHEKEDIMKIIDETIEE